MKRPLTCLVGQIGDIHGRLQPDLTETEGAAGTAEI